MSARGNTNGDRAIAGAAVASRQDFVRDVNDNLATALPYRDGDELAVLCECGRRDCSEWITMTRDLFGRVRRQPGWYVVLDGHRDDLDRVRLRSGTLAIVESRVRA
jgi:hypothetical protein